MAFTEVQERGGHRYYYRSRSVRSDGKVTKQRVYLGADLAPGALAAKERAADAELGLLEALLTPAERRELATIRAGHRRQPKATAANRYEAFTALFTYDSNAIEGNTLTLDETSQLLFDGLVPARSLREVNETLNHRRAFDRILAYKGKLTKRFVCDLHRIVVQDTLRPALAGEVGAYRSLPVFLRGVEWTPPAPEDVPKDMKQLLEWHTKNERRLHPVVLASYFHVAFELVHPFVDGNGRVGRLLLNWMLHTHGFPMVNIPSREKRSYYAALRSGQVNGDLRPFVEVVLGLYRSAPLRL